MQPGRGGMSGGPHVQQQHGRGRGRGKGRFGAEQPPPPAALKQSHADMVAALKQQHEPLTIGGERSRLVSSAADAVLAQAAAGQILHETICQLNLVSGVLFCTHGGAAGWPTHLSAQALPRAGLSFPVSCLSCIRCR